ncbi:MAG TPA: RNA polymerase factor sigma-32 [Myxococcota bacterium]|nr:RNA polymerase factor sigma-32 [Myxococcota bacterium]HQK49623.1 RNA polymerase factor sigma-32 [Myxococcota bacterium]
MSEDEDRDQEPSPAEETSEAELDLSATPARALPVPADSEGRVDLLYRYIKDIQRYPLLTPEEEQRLTRTYAETKDPRLAALLVSSNLRLVVKIALEYRTFTGQVLDLIQEGNIGLVQAVNHFDPLRGVRLSHYAQYWIRSYIIYYLLNNHRMVKLGTTQAQRKIFFNLRRERQRLQNMGFDPTAKLIAQNLSVPEETVQEMMDRMDQPDLYLDAPRDPEGKTTLLSTLAGSENPEEETSAQEITDRLKAKIAEFGATLDNERDRYIWDRRLLSDDPVTLQEVGERFGVSRERARQVEERIKKRFKEFLKRELGDDFVETQVFRP